MTTTDAQSPPAPDDTPAVTRIARRTLLRWGDTVVGTAVTAEEVTTALVTGLLRSTGYRARRQVAGLTDRGAAERARWTERVERSARAAVTAVATSPVVDIAVDHQLQRLLRPVVRAVLDDVLLLLENEPERIRTLVRGQRETMVDEVVGRMRAGADAGDVAVERATLRLLRRGAWAQAEPPPTR